MAAENLSEALIIYMYYKFSDLLTPSEFNVLRQILSHANCSLVLAQREFDHCIDAEELIPRKKTVV